MSNTIIEDGTGKGFLAKVDSTNKLEVRAVSLPSRSSAVQLEEGFEIGTLPVTFTGTSETALLFVKNNGSTLILEVFEFSGAESTGGTSDVCLLKLYQLPTGITNGTPGGAVNSRFGSSKSLKVDVEIGDGSTSAVSGGSLFGGSYVKYVGQAVFDGPWVLPQGQSVALTVTPPASNTSMPLGVRIRCHIQQGDD